MADRGFTYESHGIDSGGNHYYSRDCGNWPNAYEDLNTNYSDGAHYYAEPDAGTNYNHNGEGGGGADDGADGGEAYPSPSGAGHASAGSGPASASDRRYGAASEPAHTPSSSSSPSSSSEHASTPPPEHHFRWSFSSSGQRTTSWPRSSTTVTWDNRVAMSFKVKPAGSGSSRNRPAGA